MGYRSYSSAIYFLTTGIAEADHSSAISIDDTVRVTDVEAVNVYGGAPLEQTHKYEIPANKACNLLSHQGFHCRAYTCPVP